MDDVSLGLMLDLVGTFVFGLSGATLAVRRDFDIFGILVLAMAAALAGGVIRDVLLGATPPAAFSDTRYIGAAALAAGAAFVGYRVIERLAKPVMLLDALGLGLFAVSGCRKALEAGLDPMPAVILGVVTAVGGGALRDMLVAEPPRVLREEVYALAALIGAIIVVAGEAMALPPGWAAAIGVVMTAGFRIVSVWRGWNAPRAPGSGKAR
ncbi:trimeric intracellular cation channel family protein [Roseovarius sp.]|jgi:uncharacterized membrane protein YeiH